MRPEQLGGRAEIDPATRRLIEALFRHAPAPSWSIERHRETFETAAQTRPLAPEVETSEASIDHPKAEWAAPPRADRRVVLYLHGGGFVMGSLPTTRPLATWLAAATGIRVLYPEYRLAPEFPHPAAVDDAYDAYEWLLEQGVEPSSIALAGDSAGCGLAIMAMRRMLDQDLPLPAACVLMSPFIDLALTAPSIEENADLDPQAPAWLLKQMVRAYLGDADPTDPAVSAFHTSPRGLPPLLIQTGELESMRDDGIRFAERARDAGVDVSLEVWPAGIHVWHAFAPRLPAANQALDVIGRWLGERIRPQVY